MKKNNNKNKIIFVIVVLILFMILSLLMFIRGYTQKQNNNISYVEINQLAEIINNLGSKYILVKNSEENGYVKDIYLEFKYNLYENNESKEKVYTNLIENIVSFEKSNIRLIDESRNIIIRINYNVNENSYYYTINNEKDYFKKQDSINSFKLNKEIPNTDIRVNSEELVNIIENNWSSSSVAIDGEMNRFNNYEEYFYNGIKIRNIMSKVYNVVFTENYEEAIINGIEVGTSFEKIEDILGKPTLKKENVIGYKNEDLYVFFSENEISIYRNETYETEEFTDLLSQYLNSEINLKKFMNELTYLWDDYTEYNYSSNYISIKYPHKGVAIDMDSYDDTLGIVLYQNFSMNEKIDEFVKKGLVTFEFENQILVIEQNRIESESDELYKARFLYNDSLEDDIYKSELFMEIFVHNLEGEVKGVRFYSINKEQPNIEIKENIYTLVWLSDHEIFYSVKNKGIYYFNLKNKFTQDLVLGADEFFIMNYEDGVLKYDDKIIEVEKE